MSVADELVRTVRARAGGRCEYCAMHDALQGATFHVEHVRPRSLGGLSELENLAWACPGCNLHKANRVSVPDPLDGTLVPLFNPRADLWWEHFRWEGYVLVPLTAVGRSTAEALDLNHPRRLRIRRAEHLFSLFPP